MKIALILSIVVILFLGILNSHEEASNGTKVTQLSELAINSTENNHKLNTSGEIKYHDIWKTALESGDSTMILNELLDSDNDDLLRKSIEAYRLGYVFEAQHGLEVALERYITTTKTAMSIAELLTNDAQDSARLYWITQTLGKKFAEKELEKNNNVDQNKIKEEAYLTVINALADHGKSDLIINFSADALRDLPGDKKVISSLATAYADRMNFSGAISIIQSIEYITGSYDSDILKAQMAQYYYRNGNPELAEKYANELRLENSLAMDMIENIPKSDS